MKASLGRLARRANLWIAARTGLRLVRTARHYVVTRDYYAPIPTLADADADRWVPLQGIDLDLERQLRFAGEELGPYLREWTPLRDGQPGTGGFYLNNGSYQSVDAEVLYATIRRFRPQRIVELGSGFSTLVAAKACRRNADEGDPPDYAVYDPFPRPAVAPADADFPTRQERLRGQDVPIGVFDELEAGDILFVDTSHTVKLGSEVNRVVLEVLPRLASGVLVHFHDIFLPWDYHPQLLAEGRYYAEQYLLQAYLAENPNWEILFAGHALMREHRAELERLVPSFEGSDHYSLSFWMRRR